jgi:4-hydroxybenzoate polyprenyltransferase
MFSFTFNYFLKYYNLIRPSGWRYSFLPLVMGFCYLWIIFFELPFSKNCITLLTLFFISSIGFSASGFLINEYFDIEYDRQAGKKNFLSGLSGVVIFLLVTLGLVLALIPWIHLPANNFSKGLIITELLLFILYSATGIRLKEIWFLSGIADSLYAYVIPLTLSFNTFYLYSGNQIIPSLFLSFLLFCFFLVGYRNYLFHQIQDLENDSKTKNLTLPKKFGIAFSKNVIVLLIIFEIILFPLSVYFGFKSKKILILLCAIYFCYLLCHFIFFLLRRNVNLNFNNSFYQVIMPVFFLIWLVFSDLIWGIVLAIHSIILIPAFIREKFFLSLYILYRQLIFSPLSVIVNQLIYYLFCLMGVDLIKEKKSAAEYLKSIFKK